MHMSNSLVADAKETRALASVRIREVGHSDPISTKAQVPMMPLQVFQVEERAGLLPCPHRGGGLTSSCP